MLQLPLRLLSVILLAILINGTASAAPSIDAVVGTWTGRYTCLQGIVKLDLAVSRADDGSLKALFNFSPPPENPGIPSGSYAMSGTYTPTSGTLQFTPVRWITQPPGYVMVGLTGQVTSNGSALSYNGAVSGPGCTTFNVSKTDTPPRDYLVTFSLFIPANYVPGGPTEQCFRKGSVTPRQLIYKGDDRLFAMNGASSRGRQTFSVSPDVAGDLDGLKDGSLTTRIGETISYTEKDTLANGRIDAKDNDGRLNDCILLHNRKTASSRNMRVTSQRIGDKKIKVHIFGSLGNPLIPVSITADWDLTLTIDVSGTRPTWSLEGKRDTFPSYEIYIGKQRIHAYSPGKPPFTWLQLLRGLAGPMKTIKMTSGNLETGS